MHYEVGVDLSLAITELSPFSRRSARANFASNEGISGDLERHYWKRGSTSKSLARKGQRTAYRSAPPEGSQKPLTPLENSAVQDDVDLAQGNIQKTLGVRAATYLSAPWTEKCMKA